MNTLAFAIPVALAWLYATLGGVEFGLPFVWLLAPKADHQHLASYFSPVWETTNVFFVMALTAMFVLFPGAITPLSQQLRGPLLLTGAFLLIRALFVLIVFYAGSRKPAALWTLAIVSLALPATLAQIPLRLITGPNPGLLTGITFGLFGVISSIALATSVFASRPKASAEIKNQAKLWVLGAVASAIWLLASLLQLRPDLTTGSSVSGWWLLVLAGPMLWLMAGSIMQHLKSLLAGTVMLSFGLWTFFFVHQLPYLGYPSLTLGSAIGSSLTTWTVILSTAFFTVVLLPLGVWLYTSALADPIK